MNAAPVKKGYGLRETTSVASRVDHKGPTLVRSHGGDQIRVWGAQPRVFWLRISFLSGILGLLSYGLLTMAVPFRGFEFMALGLCGYVVHLLTGEARALQEIQVVVTDETGITLSAWQGARTVRWDEIRAVERSPWHAGAGYLWIEADQPAHIDWAGYTLAARRELTTLIEQKRAVNYYLIPSQDQASPAD